MRVIPLSAKAVMAALKKMGYDQINSDGRHRIWAHPKKEQKVCVPDHKQLKTGTLRNCIRQSGLTVEEFYSFVEGR